MPTDFGQSIAAAAAIAYGSWLFLIVTAYFADILQATVLRGRKGAGWISFFFFLVLAGAVAALQNKLERPCGPVSTLLLLFSSSASADGLWIGN